MSKARRMFQLFITTLAVLILPYSYEALTPTRNSEPPPITAIITIKTTPESVVSVTGFFSRLREEDRRKSFTIATTAAGLSLGERVEGLELRDPQGNPIAFRKMGPGEYLAEREINQWSYTIALSSAADPRTAAHASWIKGDVGILMLREILPEFGPLRRTSAWINLVSPAGLSVEGLRPLNIALFGGSLPQVPGGKWYGTDDEAVALLGTGWRNRRIASLPEVDLMMSSQWLFSDEEAERMVSEVYKEYTKLFRQDPLSGARISLAKFPRDVKPGDWEAETRGNNVTIISSDMPFKTQSLQRLHEQLRHELFHLWIPNGVNLTGNYDWFYEGFALYQSLKLAVALNRIRFEDFLDTLSRAHTIDNAQSQRISLIQASTNRFGGSNTQVYARGMLVAFLTDLTMLERSKGKRSVEDLLKDLYVKHRKPTEPTDGNRAVTEMLKTRADAGSIVEKYIAGAQKIDWTNELGAVGIEDSDPGPLTSLRVKEKLNGGQKAILDKLGYNNWRKLSGPSK